MGLLLFITWACGGGTVPRPQDPSVDHGYGTLAAALMQAVMDEQPTAGLQQQLAEADPKKLAEELTNDGLRRAFWINVYNAYIIISLRGHEELFEDRGDFFTEERFTVAGQSLSFDLVEHGILRRSKNKLSLGYLNKLSVNKFEKMFRVDAVDARIHFALNCGATSCPPVRVYHPDQVEQELDDSVSKYLRKVTEVEADEVSTTVLFSWFRNDFSDRGGITAYLHRYHAIPSTLTDPDISFKEYNWTLDIDNFVE